MTSIFLFVGPIYAFSVNFDENNQKVQELSATSKIVFATLVVKSDTPFTYIFWILKVLSSEVSSWLTRAGALLTQQKNSRFESQFSLLWRNIFRFLFNILLVYNLIFSYLKFEVIWLKTDKRNRSAKKCIKKRANSLQKLPHGSNYIFLCFYFVFFMTASKYSAQTQLCSWIFEWIMT